MTQELVHPSTPTDDPWWKRWLVRPVEKQLTRGISPRNVAWTIALGVVTGIFPVMGTTTLLSLAVASSLGLNQPVIHVSRAVVYPLHLALILPFIRLGERIYGVPLLTFSIPQLIQKFKADPLQFARDFGAAAGQGVTAWLLVSPLLALFIYVVAKPLIERLQSKLKPVKVE